MLSFLYQTLAKLYNVFKFTTERKNSLKSLLNFKAIVIEILKIVNVHNILNNMFI